MTLPVLRLPVLAAVALAGCRPASERGARAVPPALDLTPLMVPPDVGSKVDAMRKISWPSELDPQVDQARADLSRALNVEPETIEVVSAAMVVWPDSSLGCPQPGEYYLQVLTDGVHIVLKAGTGRYAYHAAKGKPPFRCERPSSPAELREYQ